MSFLATTRVDVLRGSAPAENGIGDEIDEDVVAIADKRASIIERRRNVFDQTSQTWRAIAYFACRLDSGVAVQDGDRVRDRVSGTIYSIDNIKRTPRTIAGRGEVLLDLRDPSRSSE